jgi:hypothetical protein
MVTAKGLTGAYATWCYGDEGSSWEGELREEFRGILTEGINDRLSGGVRPAAVNGASVERSSVCGDLKHREAELDEAMSLEGMWQGSGALL